MYRPILSTVVAGFAAIAVTWLLVSAAVAQQPVPNNSPAAGPYRPQRVASNVPHRTDAGPRTAMPPQPVMPLAPSWIPLPPKHEEYLTQILQYWEHNSSQIKRYRCEFKRWIYDPEFGPRNTFKTYSEGQIMYSAPDKGLFRVQKSQQYQPPRAAGGQPGFVQLPDEQNECWICDGHWIFQYDHPNKQLIQQELPPEMRGQAIASGPLPFMFNAKAEDIRRRFWIRVVTPREAKTEYWLEAVPKTQEDAANFQLAQVVIDGKDFLPKAMVLYGRVLTPPPPAGGPTAPLPPPPKTSFQFENREINFSVLAQQLNLFHQKFYEPDVPSGWSKVVNRWDQPPLPTASNPAAPARGTATRR